MLGLKLIHVSKRGPEKQICTKKACIWWEKSTVGARNFEVSVPSVLTQQQNGDAFLNTKS